MVASLQDVYLQAGTELAAVDAVIREAVSSLAPNLEELALQFIDAGGKRLRPLMTILTAKLGTPDTEQIIMAAAALELVHLGSLVHDDVVDNSSLRRGQPSVNSIHGNKTAVLLGDFFFARSLDLARQAGTEAVAAISTVISNLVEGEFAQLQDSYDLTIVEADYWDRIQRKTASFIAECCRLGGLYSFGNPVKPETLHAYGLNLGLAYQVKDDLLDFTSAAEMLGKPSQHDLKQGVLTLPIIHTLTFHPRRAEIGVLIKSKREQDLLEVLNCMREIDSFAFAEASAAALIANAKDNLREAPKHEAKTALLLIADFVLSRAH